MRPGEEQREKLRTETNPRLLTKAAMAFANSEAAEDHQLLASALGSAAFLGRLDEPENYQGTYTDLRLGRVLQALAANPAPSANAVLLQLAGSATFLEDVLRVQLLIQLLAVIRPSPPQAIEYWDRVSGPGSPLAFDVIQALLTNQSEPAMRLFETKLADARHNPEERTDWMRGLVVPHRRDLPLLNSTARLLSGSLEPPLKSRLIEVLFAYRPDDWYVLCEPPKPPSDLALPADVRDMVVRTGEYAMANLELDPGLKAVVESTLEALA